MNNTPHSPLDALKAYIQTEIEGHRFYQMAAERTENALGKKMFLSLANDELEHARKLSSEYRSVSEAGRWLTVEELSQQGREGAQESFPVFPSDEQRISALIPEGSDDLQALTIAINIEKESYQQYARAAAEASDEAAKALFQRLMVEENRHLKIVESSYEYLADTGSWFQDIEKPIFEG